MTLNLFEQKVEKVPKETVERKKEIKRIIESLLFSSAEPLSLPKIKEIIDPTYPVRSHEIHALILELNVEYAKERRSFSIDEIAGGYLFRTLKEMQPYLELLNQNRRPERLSRAACEVLAIVSYKQPITRLEIDKVRGVDSSGTLHSLMERGLIEVTGRLDAPGRPSQYGTSKRFLKHFGLKNLSELDSSLKA